MPVRRVGRLLIESVNLLHGGRGEGGGGGRPEMNSGFDVCSRTAFYLDRMTLLHLLVYLLHKWINQERNTIRSNHLNTHTK